MTRYWVIRTDKGTTDWIWSELQEGRLRQGWGYRDDQDLHLIAAAVTAREPLNKDQQDTWRGNRRLLETEPDGVKLGDLVLLPHLPRRGTWSLARVAGPYRWEGPGHPNAWAMPDFGHVLPVEPISKPISAAILVPLGAAQRRSMPIIHEKWGGLRGLNP